jgi:hypothetical protein
VATIEYNDIIFASTASGSPPPPPPQQQQQQQQQLRKDATLRTKTPTTPTTADFVPTAQNLQGAETLLYAAELAEATVSMTPSPTTTTTTTTTGTAAENPRLIADSDVTDNDVLLGRGGRTNHHIGNRNYLQYKLVVQDQYMRANSRKAKTALAYQLVQMVHAKKGRFLSIWEPPSQQPQQQQRRQRNAQQQKQKQDPPPQQVPHQSTVIWYEVDVSTARKKASQTLREISTPEFRAAKRARYSHHRSS